MAGPAVSDGVAVATGIAAGRAGAVQGAVQGGGRGGDAPARGCLGGAVAIGAGAVRVPAADISGPTGCRQAGGGQRDQSEKAGSERADDGGGTEGVCGQGG